MSQAEWQQVQILIEQCCYPQSAVKVYRSDRKLACKFNRFGIFSMRIGLHVFKKKIYGEDGFFPVHVAPHNDLPQAFIKRSCVHTKNRFNSLSFCFYACL